MARSARALVIELVADVKEFVKGTQEADDALSDFVSDAERDIRDLDRAGDKLNDFGKDAGRNIDDLARDVDRDFDKIGQSAKDASEDAERAFDNLAREAKRSFQKIDDDADRELGSTGVRGTFREAGAEAGAEFAQNMGEGISSGDFSGVATGTAGGLAASFSAMGPVGVIAGIGVGIAGVMFDHFLSESKERARQIAVLVDKQMAGVVEKFDKSLRETTAGENLAELLTEIGGGSQRAGFEKIVDAANILGLSVDDVLAGLKDGTIKTGDVTAAFKKTTEEAKKTGAAVAPIAKAQTTIKDAMNLQSQSAAKTAIATTVMANAMDPAAADAAELDRNTRGLAENMHGVAGDAVTMRTAMHQADSAASGILSEMLGWEAAVKASVDAMKLFKKEAGQADRNLQLLASHSDTLKENMQAAAGASIGGRNLRP